MGMEETEMKLNKTSDSQIEGIQIRFMGAAMEIVKARNSGPNNVIILSREQAISLAQCILTKFK